MLSVDQLGQVAPFLVIGAVPEYLVDAEIGVGAVAEADAWGASGNLFHGDGVGQVAKSGAAVFFRDSDTQESKVAQSGPQVSWERVGLVDLRGPWCDLLGRELPHGVPDEVNCLTQGVIQPTISGPPGSHCVPPLSLWL